MLAASTIQSLAGFGSSFLSKEHPEKNAKSMMMHAEYFNRVIKAYQSLTIFFVKTDSPEVMVRK